MTIPVAGASKFYAWYMRMIMRSSQPTYWLYDTMECETKWLHDRAGSARRVLAQYEIICRRIIEERWNVHRKIGTARRDRAK
ncbi:MAG TPA: hypothetical protein VD884_07725 [Ohtaekwangia sp.]|nr:hypothetical protein [Ohtaekwangia sp.]